MKKRYSIGFFAAFFLIISLLAIGYQLSYQYRMDKQEAKSAKEENTQFISTKGEATKNEGYYLKELHGYVAVYLSDGETLYELTEYFLFVTSERSAGSCANRKIRGDDEKTVRFFGKLLQLEKSIWTKFLK